MRPTDCIAGCCRKCCWWSSSGDKVALRLQECAVCRGLLASSRQSLVSTARLVALSACLFSSPRYRNPIGTLTFMRAGHRRDSVSGREYAVNECRQWAYLQRKSSGKDSYVGQFCHWEWPCVGLLGQNLSFFSPTTCVLLTFPKHYDRTFPWITSSWHVLILFNVNYLKFCCYF